MNTDLGLRGKVALTTGSASGIGEAIARRLAGEGARVVIHGHPRQQADAEAIAQSIRDAGGEAAAEVADLEDAAACAPLIEAAVARWGRLDLLVNNAAVIPRAPLEGTDAALFDLAMAVNVRAPLLLIRAAWAHMRERGGGRVLNIGSINAYCGEPVLLAYSISKGALTTLTRNLADAHAREGLRINQINPGWVLTDNEYKSKVAEGLSADWPRRIPPEIAPSGRIFRPEEIAHFAVQFLSQQGELVNGAVVELEQFPVIGRNPNKASGF
jgi:NAD(P)-dependent dehydrogenase (short-subunit alcohol dehydrogenase family)